MVSIKRMWFLIIVMWMTWLATGTAILTPQVAAQTARQRYDAAMDEWQDVYVEILKVYSEFQICDEEKAEALQQQFLELKVKGDTLAEKTILAAVDCVQESTTPDPDLLAFLEPLSEQYYEESKYEVSARAGRALRKHNRDNFALFFNTLRSSFFSNDFEHAGEMFDELKSRNEWLESDGSLPGALLPLYETHQQLLDLWKKEKETRAAEGLKDHLPRICFETTKGPIVVELFEDQHPDFVNNLMSLLQETEDPFFSDLSIFFYLQHQFAITGSEADDGSQVRPLGLITDEELNRTRGNFRGSFSLDVQDLGNGQKAVSTACRFIQIPVPELNGNSLVLGRVIEGMDVVTRFEKTHELDESHNIKPLEAVVPDRVTRVTILRKPEGKVYKPVETGKNQNEN